MEHLNWALEDGQVVYLAGEQMPFTELWMKGAERGT